MPFKNHLSTLSIYLGSAFSLAGIQAIGPGLPELQEHFRLTDSQALWAVSFYLFPGILAAVPLGKMADSIGRMKMFGICLIVFGMSSLIIPLTSVSWALFLCVRIVQGTAFAGILPLSIILVTDHGKGSSVLQRQGMRSVSQEVANTLHPIFGGVLATLVWYAPYLLGVAALPVGLMIFLLGFEDDYRKPVKGSETSKLNIFKNLPLVSLVFGGFLRFFVKFIPLSCLGILLVNKHGYSPLLAGIAIALSSAVGIFGALSADKLNNHFSTFVISISTLLLLSISLIAMSLSSSLILIILSVSLFGFSDGLYGTVQNSYVSVAVPNHLRGSFSGIVAMARNMGKFFAPITMGTLLTRVSIDTAFVISGLLASLGIMLMPPLRHFEAELSKSTD